MTFSELPTLISPPIEATRFRIPVEDTNQEPIEQYFESAVEFIEKERCEGSSVLVHCKSGVSRSMTIVLAYLVKTGLPVRESFVKLRSIDMKCCPNPSFMRHLLEFEEQVLGSASIEIANYVEWYQNSNRHRYCFTSGRKDVPFPLFLDLEDKKDSPMPHLLRRCERNDVFGGNKKNKFQPSDLGDINYGNYGVFDDECVKRRKIYFNKNVVATNGAS